MIVGVPGMNHASVFATYAGQAACERRDEWHQHHLEDDDQRRQGRDSPSIHGAMVGSVVGHTIRSNADDAETPLGTWCRTHHTVRRALPPVDLDRTA